MTGQRLECACQRTRHTHGTAACRTVCGCRCFPCRVAYAQQVADRRAGRRGAGTPRVQGFIPAIGVTRRIQALHTLGWTCRDLADRLGYAFQYVHKLRTSSAAVQPATYLAVTALYDTLWDKPAPAGQSATYVRNLAAREGWAPPMAWDDIDDPTEHPAPLDPDDRIDEVAVDEATSGRRVPLTRAEYAAAVAVLTGRGYSADQAAERLGSNSRRVCRARAAARREDAA